MKVFDPRQNEKVYPGADQQGSTLDSMLANLSDEMDVSMVEFDLHYRIRSCNTKTILVYGTGIIGKLCYQVFCKGSTPCTDCPVNHVYQSGTKARATKKHVDATATPLYVDHIATPFFNHQQELVGVFTLLVDITQQKKTEEELHYHKDLFRSFAHNREADLRESEHKFALAFDASPDSININRLADGLYVEVNKGFTELTGFTIEDVRGKRSSDINIWYKPEEREQLTDLLKRNGYCENLEATFRRKDGSLVIGLMSARVIHLKGIAHILSITRDISLLKKLEHEHIAQKTLFETMFNAINDGIVITNTQGEILLANEGMKTTFGYDESELVGKTTALLYADQHTFKDTGTNLYNGNAESLSQLYTTRCKHKSGNTFSGETFGASLFDNADRWIGNVDIIRDISQRQQTEIERERLMAAIQQISEMIIITDLDNNILYTNPAFEQVTGYSSEEVMGCNPRILKSGEQEPSFYQELWNTLTQGRTFQGRMVNKRKDGTLYTEETTISPIIGPDGATANYVAVKRDISEQVQMERQFQQAQKMESIGRLTGGVAHDFNNILGVIIGYGELALDEVDPSAKLYRNLEKILDAAERSANIIKKLLAFTRQQTITPEPLNLNETMHGMSSMLRRLIGEEITLDCEGHADLPLIKIDPSQVDQILANLCVNAKDAIESTGRIAIETERINLDESYCKIHPGSHPGEYVLLSVSDDGIGMDREIANKIFEPFFTTKRRGQGTGLGLSTVYGIVKQNNGFVNVYSEPGYGTTMKIYFPVYKGEASLTSKTNHDPARNRGSETILVVEDDRAVQVMIKAMLEKLGYTVLTARLPQEALQIAAEAALCIDLLLTDVVMPEMNGKELAGRLVEARPELNCLYMSGYTPNVIAHRGILSDDINFIQKPFSINTLALKIREVLG